MLNFLTLFRNRRLPRRKRKAAANGGWQINLRSLSGPIGIAPGEAAALARGQPPRRRKQASKRPASRERTDYLAAHGVEKRYGTRTVVKNVSLYVRRGEAVGLLGPNGAGKTTAFYMITGLVKADRGQIELDGYDVTHLPMYQRARLGIGYLPQEASIFRGLNVEDNIRAVLEVVEPQQAPPRGRPRRAARRVRHHAPRKTPSIALSGRRAATGGDRPRAGEPPDFMLLDEPFAGIDPIAIIEIQRLVRHLTNRGIGVLITDHNVRETLALIDRAYIIYVGRGPDRGQSGRYRERSRSKAPLSRRRVPDLTVWRDPAARFNHSPGELVYTGTRTG